MFDQDTNTQNKFAKDCIFTALMKLMGKKNFHEISITEITNKAGVSRMAYYRNYRSKEDIIIQYLNELFNVYLNEILMLEEINVYQFAYKYFSYFRKHEILIKNLVKSDLSNLLLERFDTYLQSIFEQILTYKNSFTEIKKYEVHFLAGGLYKVLVEWIQNGMVDSDEDMAGLIFELAPKESC